MLAFVFIIFLAGCSSAGDWLSGSAVKRKPAITYPHKLEQIQIGVTTKEEVQRLLGTPMDIQRAPDQVQGGEAWAYAKVNPSIHPLQYVPGFGVFALSKHRRPSSFSISFSADGAVDGIVLREVQPFGNSGASTALPSTEVSPYGRNNPLSHHLRHDASFQSGRDGQ